MCVADPPTQLPPASGGERPWAHNTGPTNPSALRTLGSTTITTDGTVLENFDMSGRLFIQANNVTVRNFKIRTTDFFGIRVFSGYTGTVIEDGEISGTTTANIRADGPIIARRLHLYDAQGDGFKIEGNGSLVEYCYIETLGSREESHADGNQTQGGSNITFRFNNFDLPHRNSPNAIPPYQVNRPFMLSETFSNFVVENNWINGGNYSVTCLPGVTYRNNVFGRDYLYNVDGGGGGCVWNNNRFEDTGELIP